MGLKPQRTGFCLSTSFQGEPHARCRVMLPGHIMQENIHGPSYEQRFRRTGKQGVEIPAQILNNIMSIFPGYVIESKHGNHVVMGSRFSQVD